MENRMDSKVRRETETIGAGANGFDDLEGSEVRVIQLLARTIGLDVGLFEPNFVAWVELDGVLSMLVRIMFVGCLSLCEIRPTELMNLLKLLGEVFGSRGGHSGDSAGETRVVPEVGEERRDLGGRGSGVVVGKLGHRKKLYPVVLVEIDKDSKVLFQNGVDSLGLSI
jgi:hypothetical protein